MGTRPAPLPDPLTSLTLKLADQRTSSPLHQPSPKIPLFPGRPASQPISAEALRRRLTRHGITTTARSARSTALAEFAADLPAPVLADLLGLHPKTAAAWTRTLQRDWTPYLAARADASEMFQADGHHEPGHET